MSASPAPERPLVSVVMIFKDAAPFLEQAAASVLGQTWRPLELLLVDDGGRDGSDAIAEGIAAAHPGRVRMLRHPGRANLGTGPSRSLGIRAATGAHTAFLDADDYWEPEHLAHEVGLLLAHPEADMVVGRATTWRSWDGGTDETTPLPFAPGRVVLPPRLLAAVLRNGSMATPTCSLLVRTEALRGCLASLDAFRSTYEDQVINTLLQLRCTAVISGTATARYRQHASSLSAQALRSGHESVSGPSLSRQRFVRWLGSLPEVHADPTGRLQALVRRALDEQSGSGAARAWARRMSRTALITAGAERQARRLRLALRTRDDEARGSQDGRPETAPAWAPIHRRYAGAFLAEFGEDLCGDVWQLGSLPADPGHNVLEVARADLSPASCDCVLVAVDTAADDVQALLASSRAALRPGGALLAFLPGIRRLDPADPRSAVVWTAAATEELLQTSFDPWLVTVRQAGNPAAALAALRGGAPGRAQTAADDPTCPVIVMARALVPV